MKQRIPSLNDYINESTLKPALYIMSKDGKLFPGIILKVPNGYDINSGPFKDIDELTAYAKKQKKELDSTDVKDLTK